MMVLRFILLVLAAVALMGASSPPPPSLDGLWRYSHARCAMVDVVPSGYDQILVIQGVEASQETRVAGCASQTRVLIRRDTADGAVLRYTGAATTCSPGPLCFGTFQTAFAGRTAVATFACAAGLAFGESGPFTLTGPDTLETRLPGERGCVSVYTRVPGP